MEVENAPVFQKPFVLCIFFVFCADLVLSQSTKSAESAISATPTLHGVSVGTLWAHQIGVWMLQFAAPTSHEMNIKNTPLETRFGFNGRVRINSGQIISNLLSESLLPSLLECREVFSRVVE